MRVLLGVVVCWLGLSPGGAAEPMPGPQGQSESTGAAGAKVERSPNVVIFLTDDQKEKGVRHKLLT